MSPQHNSLPEFWTTCWVLPSYCSRQYSHCWRGQDSPWKCFSESWAHMGRDRLEVLEVDSFGPQRCRHTSITSNRCGVDVLYEVRGQLASFHRRSTEKLWCSLALLVLEQRPGAEVHLWIFTTFISQRVGHAEKLLRTTHTGLNLGCLHV